MPFPNFLIIGAAKAGTTTIADALEQHPEVYITPVKETNFFALHGKKLDFYRKSVCQGYLDNCCLDFESYQRQFQNLGDAKVAGEASPSYLFFPEVAKKIKAYNPDMKLVAILRNPVERAYSNFLHHIRDELETTNDFSLAVSLENERIAANWWWGFHYAKAGLYYQQLKIYYNVFPANNIKVYLFDDLIDDSNKLVQDIFKFLGVDYNFEADLSIQKNQTGVPKNRELNRFLRYNNPVKSVLKPLVPASIRKQIIAKINQSNLDKPNIPREAINYLNFFFEEDILKLQDLIQKDLSAWIKI